VARWEFMPRLRRALAPPESKGLSDRVRASSASYLVPGIPYAQDWSTRRAVEEAYEANPLVYRAVTVMCQTALKQPMVLFQGDEKDGKKITKPDQDPTRLLYALNRRANPWETGKIFRHRLIAQYILSSRGVYVEVVRTRGGGIGLLNVIDPDLVRMVPTKTDPMAGFEVTTPSGSTRTYNYLPRYDPTVGAEQQPVSILWIRSPHPLVMWEGMSPVQAAGLSIDLDKYARLYNRRFLQNDGRPGGLLSVKGVVDRDTLDLIQAQFTGGTESPGRTTVIQADAISYADTSGTPRDMMWGELSKLTKEEISTAFGVPMSILTSAKGETFDNADADYAMFWELCMENLIMMVDDQLDILTGGYDDDLILRHDLSDVWVLGRHRREQQDRQAADYDRGAITLDEYRDATDRDRWNVPATSVLWVPPGRMAVSANPDSTESQDAADVPQAAPAGAPVAATATRTDHGAAPAGMPALDSGQDGLRMIAGARDAPGDVTALERADLLGGRDADLEGKESRPRFNGSALGAADWR
jgi:HK97 family phage portal protein